ncbi:unnamed protein product, partial [Diamesa serratosioi]
VATPTTDDEECNSIMARILEENPGMDLEKQDLIRKEIKSNVGKESADSIIKRLTKRFNFSFNFAMPWSFRSSKPKAAKEIEEVATPTTDDEECNSIMARILEENPGMDLEKQELIRKEIKSNVGKESADSIIKRLTKRFNFSFNFGKPWSFRSSKPKATKEIEEVATPTTDDEECNSIMARILEENPGMDLEKQDLIRKEIKSNVGKESADSIIKRLTKRFNFSFNFGKPWSFRSSKPKAVKEIEEVATPTTDDEECNSIMARILEENPGMDPEKQDLIRKEIKSSVGKETKEIEEVATPTTDDEECNSIMARILEENPGMDLEKQELIRKEIKSNVGKESADSIIKRLTKRFNFSFNFAMPWSFKSSKPKAAKEIEEVATPTTDDEECNSIMARILEENPGMDLEKQESILLTTLLLNKQSSLQEKLFLELCLTMMFHLGKNFPISKNSVDRKDLSDLTSMQQELLEINNRYNFIGVRLTDRQKDLDDTTDAVQKQKENLDFLNKFVEKLEKDLPKSNITVRDNADKSIKKLRKQLDEMFEKQSVLDSTKSQVKDLIQNKPNVAGAESLKYELETLLERWQRLSDLLRECISNSEKSIEFLDTNEQILSWLVAKDKLLSVLGPISSDPHTVRSQMQQVQVLKDEFPHKPTLQYQIETHDPIFREVMSKEYEIIMLLNKGKELKDKLGEEAENLEKISTQWQRLKDETQERQTRLQKCSEQYKNYEKVSGTFLQWFNNAERDLSLLKPGQLTKKELDREMKDLQMLRNELLKKSSDYDKTQNLGEGFLASCDIDKETLAAEMKSIKERWDELNRIITSKLDTISAFIEKLMDYNDQFKQLSNLVQRNEDAFDSLDKLHGVAGKDPKSLDKIKSIQEDNAELKKSFQNVRLLVENIATETRSAGYNSDNLYGELELLSDRILTLQSRLDERIKDLQIASNAVAQFTESVNHITVDLQSLENEVDALSSPGRELKIVKAQLENATDLMGKIEDLNARIGEIESNGGAMIGKGFVSRPSEIHEPIEQIKRKRSRLDSRTREYLDTIQKALNMLKKFYDDYKIATNEISQIDIDLNKIKSVGSEAQQIRLQQQEFQTFRKQVVDPMDKKVDNLNDLGQDLIRSAQDNVSTVTLEADLEKLVQNWNSIKERVSERDRKLDQALLQTGKFQDALKGLINWLKDSEDMINNQKSPSIDYKVVKAQLQEQKFLMKMIGDNEYSITSLVQLGEEVAVGCEPTEKINIEFQLKDLKNRFDQLKSKSNDRTKLLESAIDVAKLLQDQISPLTAFLDKSEKSLKKLENIPSDEDKVQKCIFEHDRLNHEIIAKNGDVTSLAALKGDIRKYFEPEEAEAANEKIDVVADRYKKLRDDCDKLGSLLGKTKQVLKQLVLSCQELNAWFDKQEKQLVQFKNISVHVDVINEQIEKLQAINNEANNKETTVEATLNTAKKLIRELQSSNDNLNSMREQLEELKDVVDVVTTLSSERLSVLEQVTPLSEHFAETNEELEIWLEEIEREISLLTAPGVKSEQIIQQQDKNERIMQTVATHKPLIDKFNKTGDAFALLVARNDGAQLHEIVDNTNQRYNSLKSELRDRQLALEQALQETSQFADKLENMLKTLLNANESLKNKEPISAHPPKISNQIDENMAVSLEKVQNLHRNLSTKQTEYDALLRSGKSLIDRAPKDDEPELSRMLSELKELWTKNCSKSVERQRKLEEALMLTGQFSEALAALLE